MTLRAVPNLALAADRFPEFWDACPKKVGKPLAQLKFNAIISAAGLKTRIFDREAGTYYEVELRSTADELIRAMKAYRETQIVPSTRWDAKLQLKDNGAFTMHPSTWLNRGRWMDEF